MKSDIEAGRALGDPAGEISMLDRETVLQGSAIRKVVLRQFIERTDSELGDYSLLTVLVETDRGSVEMKYDEGFRGKDALASAARLLTQYVGLSSLINRALIELAR